MAQLCVLRKVNLGERIDLAGEDARSVEGPPGWGLPVNVPLGCE